MNQGQSRERERHVLMMDTETTKMMLVVRLALITNSGYLGDKSGMVSIMRPLTMSSLLHWCFTRGDDHTVS